MRKVVRGLVLLMVLVTGISLVFSGCGSGAPTQSQTTSGTEKAAVETTAAKAEDKILKVYSWETTLKDQNQAVISAFEAKNPGIKIQIEYPVENDNVAYTQKVDMLLLAGESIDAMLESSVAKCVNKVDRKLYQPLDPFLKKEGVNYDDIYSLSSKIGDSYYALPIDVTPWFVMMNKSMLDAANLPVPPLSWTWDDYRAYAKKLTKGEGTNKVYGSYFHTFQNYGLMGVYSTKMDNAYYKADGSLNFEDPNLKSWLQFRYDMENMDKTSVPLMDIKSLKLAYRNEFFTGKVAMVPIGSWMLAEIKNTGKWPHDFQTTFAALPKWGASGVEGRTFSDTKMFSIPTSAKYPEEAYKFIRFYTTEGAYIRAGGLTAEKNMDLNKILPKIVGDNPDKLYDMAALNTVLKNPKFVHNTPLLVPSYHSEIDNMFVSEIEVYLIGGESLDNCIANLVKKGNDIVSKAK